MYSQMSLGDSWVDVRVPRESTVSLVSSSEYRHFVTPQVVFSSSEDGWVDLKDNDTFSGCDKPCLSLNSVRACHASLYRCRVFNAAGPVFSHPIILAVGEWKHFNRVFFRRVEAF